MQEIVKKAAILAGREERAETIADGERAEQRLIEQGATITKWTQAERDAAKLEMAGVYRQFENTFTPGLIQAVEQTLLDN